MAGCPFILRTLPFALVLSVLCACGVAETSLSAQDPKEVLLTLTREDLPPVGPMLITSCCCVQRPRPVVPPHHVSHLLGEDYLTGLPRTSQSQRSASTGSTRIALRAVRQQAVKVTQARTKEPLAKAWG
jgi:hypothetical protein